MSFKTEAFVLRRRNWREADQIYDLFTPQEGIINVILKSAAKPGNKLAGHLLPFSKVKVMIGRGRLDHLAGVSIIKDHSNIRTDLRNLSLASSIAELFLNEDHSSQKLAEFVLLEDIFSLINSNSIEVDKKSWLVRIFLWKYLSMAGWQPELDKCLICQNNINSDGQYVSGRGIMCTDHQDYSAVAISYNLIKFLRYIINSNWTEFNNLTIDRELNKEWLQISQLFYQAVYDKPSQSLKLFSYG